MESEEKDDLLINVSEESESEVSDHCIQEKIFNLLERGQPSQKTWSNLLNLIFSCLILFVSSTVVIITLPIYQAQSSRCGIVIYSKIFTFATASVVLFGIFCAVNTWLKKYVRSLEPTGRLYLCLPSVFRASFLLSSGSLLVFWLTDAELVSCHLQDPLKGCVVVFSLIFYFIFSKRSNVIYSAIHNAEKADSNESNNFDGGNVGCSPLVARLNFNLNQRETVKRKALEETSAERVFCTMTVIVGTFVTVDFGLCDRFRCRGMDLPDSAPASTLLHAGCVILYVLALGALALHLTCLENCCKSSYYSSSLDMSIVSSDSSRERPASPMPTTQSLSIISGTRGPREPLNVSLRTKFPVTSTPNERPDCWVWGACDWLVAYHVTMWLLVTFFCWVPTLGLMGKEPRLLIEVLDDVSKSFVSHTVGTHCPSLWFPSTILLTSYIALCGSCICVLSITRSALTVVCVLMNALPMASLFWSIYQLDTSSPDLLNFKMAVTGEAISAMLGFPIIGIGTFLLLKSHLTEPAIHLRLH